MRKNRIILFLTGGLLLIAFLVVLMIFRKEYTRRELIITKDDKQIYGQLYLPGNGKGCYPLVILGHGYGGSYSDNLDYGRYLSSHGIGCYVFDFCGGSKESRSSGSMQDMNVWTEIDDLNDIVDYMLNGQWTDTDRVFLAGKSLGGGVAGLVASQRPQDVAGLILHYPYFIVSPEFGGDGETGIVEDVFSKIAGYEGRVLIFNGAKDRYVPLEYTQKAAEVYKDCELVVLEDSGHGFSGSARDLVKEKMAAFVLNG